MFRVHQGHPSLAGKNPAGADVMPSRQDDSTMSFDHFECFSFDCYGTLIDWETGISSALQPILERHQVAADHHALLELYGKAETEIEAGSY